MRSIPAAPHTSVFASLGGGQGIGICRRTDCWFVHRKSDAGKL